MAWFAIGSMASGYGTNGIRCTSRTVVPSWTTVSAAPRTGGLTGCTLSGGGSPPAVISPGLTRAFLLLLFAALKHMIVCLFVFLLV